MRRCRGDPDERPVCVASPRATLLAGRTILSPLWLLEMTDRGTTRSLRSRPNLFLVGAPKCATTSLAAFLAAHPDVFMASNKEPHFFSSLELSRVEDRFFGVVRMLPDYLRLFAGSEGARVRGEASTTYLGHEGAADAIAAFAPDARIVVVVRDPVERAWSHYLYNVREGVERRPFGECVAAALAGARERWPRLYVAAGRYAAQVERFLAAFGRERVLVLVFEELAADPADAGGRLLAFLGLDPLRAPAAGVELRNPYARPRGRLGGALLRRTRLRLLARLLVPPPRRPLLRRVLLVGDDKPALDPATRAALVAAYLEDVAALEGLLGRRLPWERHFGSSRQGVAAGCASSW